MTGNSESAQAIREAPHWLRPADLPTALEHGLKEAEFNNIVKLLGRELSLLELGIFSALYSEHCSYKSTKVHLRDLPTDGPQVLHGPGENAGVVDIGDGLAVVFKVESHNHPTFIEPYQGAATGVGGILRDVFTMGARPLALMNGLRFGSASEPHTKYLLSRAVAGIGGYGNCVGIPTVAGELFLHESYNGNCLVNAFALGLVRTDQIFLGSAAGVGNSIFYLGSKTGRDGIHGATMASETFEEDSEEKRPTVQVGDPFQEKLLLEACLEVMRSGAVIGIQDMGAAGLTSSSFEMASRSGTGMRLHLDRVPQRESEMNPYEIMLSESQERMLIIIESGREAEVETICKRWELDVVQVGEVIAEREVQLFWHGENVSALPVDLLTESVPQYRWPEERPATADDKLKLNLDEVQVPGDLSACWLKLLGSENLCSRREIYRQYDSTVRTNTVVHPGSDAGVIRVKSDEWQMPAGKPEKGLAMKLDCNSRYCMLDPRRGSALSVAEACRNVSAVGAQPLAISDCLNFGSPEHPAGMWQIAESIRGLGEAAREFGVPVVSGNVSLYNETKGTAIYPTPMIAMVGVLDDASKALGSQFRENSDRILILGSTDPTELGGSEYLAVVHGLECGQLPNLDYALELRVAECIRELIDRSLLRSCHDVGVGGLALAFAECCLGQYWSVGARIELEPGASGTDSRPDGVLFAETGARYIASFSPSNEAEVRDLASKHGVDVSFSGDVGGDVIEIGGYARLELAQARDVWSSGLDRVL